MATSAAADLILGRSSDFGSIKPEKYADVVAVEGDSLKDVALLENISFVMKDGIVYKWRQVAANS